MSFASVLICAYRSLSVETADSLITLLDSGTWRYSIRHGDALISRARSLVASQWYAQTDDDVFVMVDDDISFTPATLETLVSHCRNGADIVVAGYPVRNGQFMSSETLDGQPFRIGQPGLVELRYAATGCMAVHRRVLDALIPTMPLCHAGTPHAFWPMFQPIVLIDTNNVYLSEDWAFTYRARNLGLHAWLDPCAKVIHTGHVPLTLANMRGIFEAAQQE